MLDPASPNKYPAVDRVGHHVREDVDWMRFARYAIRGDALLFPVEKKSLDEAPIQVQLRDIGRGGVGFVAHRSIEPNTAWRIEFLHRGHIVGAQTVYLRFCDSVEQDLYQCGGQFIASAGLLTILGVPASAIASEPEANEDEDLYLPPCDLED